MSVSDAAGGCAGDDDLKDRCPTYLSSNPMFTHCKDPAQAKAETARDAPPLLTEAASQIESDQHLRAVVEGPERTLDRLLAHSPMAKSDENAYRRAQEDAADALKQAKEALG